MGGRVIKTVGELIEVLSRMDPETIPIALEPPFTGVRLVECDGDADGPAKVLISCPPRAKEDLVGRAKSTGKRLASATRSRSANTAVGSTAASRSNGGNTFSGANTVKPSMPRVISVGKGKNKRKFK